MMKMTNLTTNKIIDKHLYHKLTYVRGPFGPHHGKFVCKICNQFIKWANTKEIKAYTELSHK